MQAAEQLFSTGASNHPYVNFQGGIARLFPTASTSQASFLVQNKRDICIAKQQQHILKSTSQLDWPFSAKIPER